MGSIRKRGLKFQAQVRREGAQPVSKTFTLKRDAEGWMRSVEARIDVGEVNVTAPKTLTLRDLLVRYSNEITPEKKGRDQEQRRINRLLKDQISDYRLSQLDALNEYDNILKKATTVSQYINKNCTWDQRVKSILIYLKCVEN